MTQIKTAMLPAGKALTRASALGLTGVNPAAAMTAQTGPISPADPAMFKHILVATDGTPLADKALATALALARSCGAKMTALLVVPDYTSHDYIEDVIGRGLRSETLRATLAEAGKQRLALALAAHGDESVAAGRLVAVSDEPYDEILAHAERERCDVIVMASRGRGALKSALLGSQTVQVIAGSTIPVLVVK